MSDIGLRAREIINKAIRISCNTNAKWRTQPLALHFKDQFSGRIFNRM